jgi:RNA polymerase sigma factor (sigma-70 family)
MKLAESSLLIGHWVAAYGGAVEVTLTAVGIFNKEDREELKQEVFLTALLSLRQGVWITNPRAWLKECARRMAANHRQKAARRRDATSANRVLWRVERDEPEDKEELPTRQPSPEQVAQDRERLYLAWAEIDEESRSIVFALRGEGRSWQAVAAERGITIDQTRYLYNMAIKQIKASLAKAEPETTKRRTVLIPFFLLRLLEALRLELDEASPELDHQVRASLDRSRAAAGADEAEPESERISFAHSAPFQRTAPLSRPLFSHPALWQLGGGVAIVTAYLLAGTPLDEPSPDSRPAQSILALPLVEPSEPKSAIGAVAPRLAVSATSVVSGRLLPAERQSGQSSSAAAPLKEVTSFESRQIIDSVRDASSRRDTREALALLAQHAHSFPGMDMEKHRKAWQLVCAAPAGHRVKECASSLPSSAPGGSAVGGRATVW